MSPITYQLNQDEIDLAWKTGAARTSRGSNFNEIRSPRGRKFVEANGAAGEIALAGLLLRHSVIGQDLHAKMLDTIYTTGISQARLGQDDGDIAVGYYTIDVKTTEHTHGTLWLTKEKQGAHKIKGYAMMTGDIEGVYDPSIPAAQYTFCGWQHSEQILKGWNQGDRGIGRWSQEALRSPRDLFDGLDRTIPFPVRFTYQEMLTVERGYRYLTEHKMRFGGDSISEARLVEMLGGSSHFYFKILDEYGITEDEYEAMSIGELRKAVEFAELMHEAELEVERNPDQLTLPFG